jgi:hypothetical protein
MSNDDDSWLCELAGDHQWEYDPDEDFDSVLAVCRVCGEIEYVGPREEG